MGYSVQTNGRVLLPETLEAEVLAELGSDLATKDGWWHPDSPDAPEVRSLADLGAVAGARVTRDGDWLQLATDSAGDPKWSEQATAFYRGLARWVRQGQVQLYGEDGAQWSYRYAADGVTQLGTNGWDDTPPDAEEPGSLESPPFTYPGQPPRPHHPAPPTEHPRPSPEADRPGPAGEPPAWGPPSDPGRYPPASGGTGPWGGDEPAPASAARRLAMGAALVLGVLLIVGLALLASGI